MWLTCTFLAICVLFLALSGAALWHLRHVRRLPALAELQSESSDEATPSAVLCSIIIAARNEEARIEEAIRRLLRLQGVGTEIIVIDDRSDDGTSGILQRLTQEISCLRVVRVDALPGGWLGKCHACHLGAGMARGEWLLFTDADCWLKPDVLQRALLLADRDAADHVTLAPGTDIASAGTRAWYLLFLISILSWFAGVNRDRPRAHAGIGAFNLVRSKVYRQSGGHEALRLTVLDDVKLGLLVRRAGKRSRAFLGVHDVECHWGGTLSAMVKVMEKNYFAAINYRVSLVVLGTGFALTVFLFALAGLLSGSAAGIACACSPFLLCLPAASLAKEMGWPRWVAILVPPMFAGLLYALLNSTVRTLLQGGVRWRETFYPLSELRAGNVH